MRWTWLFLLVLSQPVACERSDGRKDQVGTEGTHAEPVLFSGFLKSNTTEPIHPPSGRDWSYKIIMLLPEGERVEPGTKVARLEGERDKERLRKASNNLLETKVQAESKRSEVKAALEKLRQDIADQKKEVALLETGVSPESSATSWTISARDRLIEKLKIEEARLKLKLLEEKLARKQNLAEIVEKSTAKKEAAIQAEVDNFRASLAQSDRFTTKGGVIIYKRNPWDRTKPKVGAAIYRGMEIMEVVDDKDLYVEAYLKETHWKHARKGAAVTVRILGRREVETRGRIEKISRIVLPVGDWDRSLPDGHALFEQRAFKLRIALDAVPAEAKPEGEVEIRLEPEPPRELTSEKESSHAG